MTYLVYSLKEIKKYTYKTKEIPRKITIDTIIMDFDIGNEIFFLSFSLVFFIFFTNHGTFFILLIIGFSYFKYLRTTTNW